MDSTGAVEWVTDTECIYIFVPYDDLRLRSIECESCGFDPREPQMKDQRKAQFMSPNYRRDVWRNYSIY